MMQSLNGCKKSYFCNFGFIDNLMPFVNKFVFYVPHYEGKNKNKKTLM